MILLLQPSFLLLSLASGSQIPDSLLFSLSREFSLLSRDDGVQWILVCFLLLYLSLLLLSEVKSINAVQDRSMATNGSEKLIKKVAPFYRQIFLAVFIALCAVGYGLNYAVTVRLPQIPVLIAGIFVGKLVAAWASFQSCENRRTGRVMMLLVIIVGLLSVSMLDQPVSGPSFAYHDIRRWCGPWGNPNLFGLLMAAGLTLAFGVSFASLESLSRDQVLKGNVCHKSAFTEVLFPFLCLIAIVMMGLGLYHSYSRGAWFGVLVAWIYLFFSTPISFRHRLKSGFFGASQMAVFGLLFALLVIGFWQSRFVNSCFAQRIASVANLNDFSWRNRIVALQGATRMLLDRPVVGFGWGEAEAIYALNYCTNVTNESAAIQMNDYLMMGISGGVPVLTCFICYVASSFRRRISEQRKECILKSICRSGIIVFLVGFWFDGGLFKMPVSVVFWTLLELTQLEPSQKRDVAGT